MTENKSLLKYDFLSPDRLSIRVPCLDLVMANRPSIGDLYLS